MNSNFVAALRAKLHENMNTYADDMAGGACKSFEEYQKCCGVIQGLAFAERHLLDLANALEIDDE